MKEQIRIPTGKVQRATKFLKTGAKVGGNYVRHYTRKLFDKESDGDMLHAENAEDIYNSLGELKGSALKVLQMMSLDRNILPKAYQEKFTQAQYSAPPLSYPLVVKTFNQTFGKSPEGMFETFTRRAVNAASIGQVHQATLSGKKLAVKIQYPGVAESITSDLKIVKPFAKVLFGISEADIDYYMQEVRQKLIDETDYQLELQNSMEITNACAGLNNLKFPMYYPEYSGPKVITMDWVDGMHLEQFLSANPGQEVRNQIGQAIWDFYDYQIHQLHKLHADAHPGNFIFHGDGSVSVLDFGCVKEIPDEYYRDYFRVHDKNLVYNEPLFEQWLYDLSFLNVNDTNEEKKLYKGIFSEMTKLVGRPFFEGHFDFGDDDFFMSVYRLGERIAKTKEIRNSKYPRGSKHGLYINRTYFGLYQLLNNLKAQVRTGKSQYNKLVA
jgi:predicted unusual protein kinase regulating ubiquinone biosynthesis (AarF/ABC1/UbiB family)